MDSHITKIDVFLYFANRLDRARRLELEAACASDAQVRQWFDQLTPTDEELEHPQNESESDEQGVPPSFAQHVSDVLQAVKVNKRKRNAPGEDRATIPLSKLLWLPEFDVRLHGGWKAKLDIPQTGAAGDESKPEYEAGHGKENWGNDGDTVWLDCPKELIPHGLVWLRLRESDGSVAMHLPKLDFNSQTGRWSFRKSFQELFGGRKPKERYPTLDFLPATPENRDAFLVEEVRAFVGSLPKNRLQRKLAEAYLSQVGLGDSHGD